MPGPKKEGSLSLTDPLFWGTARAPYLLLLRKLNQKKKLLEPSIFQAIHNSAHAGCQKGGVPEEANTQLYHRNPCACMNPLAGSMTDYPRDAVSAAEPLCTHGKDHAGLGALTPSN